MGLANGTSRKSLSDIVFERIHRAIKSGAYQPNERLPTEHDLATEFEVSRPIIREALKRLRDQGLIYSRRGAGSFVRVVGMREPLGFGQLENVADLLNCYEFRLTVEPAAAAAAAERHDAATLAAIRQALELMRDATNRQSHREDADFQFHLAIARASKNSYFYTAMEALKDHIAVGMRFHGASVKRETSGLARVFLEHESVTEAIASGDAARSRQLMYDHLTGSRDRLFQATR
ncbi:FadR family transcriptional regulator [Pseudorhizobium endolithicum]|uniref:FadR family transcriptional regulator n=1 Tax=Pseudorhizobium endolithicum TaxID=1191678 RepID=A0ABN7JPT7_9HYPH|nr:FadR/GntR family transcriptional regulator [Pseudorhizobium endolithicum]CAD6419362.1 FadR family transcriptional regulator [Rhizobium sp. Q54]CAD7033790.1 FadR family transcriptional regulator [Pseudorhizobium endolithicum]